MSTSHESEAGTWDDARDARFFRITAQLFAPGFCAGATVLLASYDAEPVGRPVEHAVPAALLAPAPVPRTRRAAA